MSTSGSGDDVGMKSDQQDPRPGSHSTAPALRRAFWIGWWAVVAVLIIVVAVNIVQSGTTDSVPLADEAAKALSGTGHTAEIRAVGATSDGRVFVTLVSAGTPSGASHAGSDAVRAIADDVFSQVPSATAVVILNADHGVVGTFWREH